MKEYRFGNIRERDMDLLFLEAIGTDNGFADLVVSKTKWAGKSFEVRKIELSRTDPQLGESDITVLVSVNGVSNAILIEDKIDAIAIPEQYLRYFCRGEKDRSADVYDDFEVLMICPKRYHEENEEAQKYEIFLTYEECAEYFNKKDDEISCLRAAQLNAAISKAKKPAEVVLNEDANSFFKQYRQIHQQKYFMVDMRSKETANGWWI